jgi:EspG family
MRVDTVDLKRLGRIDLLDLRVISEYLGRDFLPFPFIATLPNRFADFGAYNAHARTIPDRFNHGELSVFKKWFATYADADLRVECRVQYFPADTPSLRVLAHRAGELGFLATQQPDDVVEMFTLSPYDLGPAIAGMVDLNKPGAHPVIVIPDYVPQALRSRKQEAPEPNWGSGPPVTISSAEVTAYGTVQSHRQPARNWEVDQDKTAAVWMRLRDDGEYLYAVGYRSARPMTRRNLSERINDLIAADVAQLRQSRG